MRRIAHPKGSCCCSTYLDDSSEDKRSEMRDFGDKEDVSKLFNENLTETANLGEGGASIQ